VNARGDAGNNGAVIRALPLAAAVCALAIVGCAGPARAPGPPGMTPILLDNQVGEPCQLVWANARVDDRALERTTIAPPGSPPASLDRPVLAPGEHTVSIVASASCSGAEPAAILQVTQPVYLRDGASITIVLSRDAGAPSGLAARFAVSGGEVLAPRADGGDVDCRGRLPIDRAICRTEAALARARKDRDVIRVLCLGEKLREMRLVTETASHGAPGGAPDPHLADIDEATARRVLTLANEADQCVGDEVMGRDGSQVERGQGAALHAFN
jgi:hypothetical protein